MDGCNVTVKAVNMVDVQLSLPMGTSASSAVDIHYSPVSMHCQSATMRDRKLRCGKRLPGFGEHASGRISSLSVSRALDVLWSHEVLADAISISANVDLGVTGLLTNRRKCSW